MLDVQILGVDGTDILIALGIFVLVAGNFLVAIYLIRGGRIL